MPRVYELARELNMPSKDLIRRMMDLGFTVEGNFTDLDEATVKKVKAKMLEPVSRVEDEGHKGDDPHAAEAPRKRRIISARRSEETHKIQESLGISGPLPEDEKTREEMTHAAETAATEAHPAVEAETPAEHAPVVHLGEPEPQPVVAAQATHGGSAAPRPEGSPRVEAGHRPEPSPRYEQGQRPPYQPRPDQPPRSYPRPEGRGGVAAPYAPRTGAPGGPGGSRPAGGPGGAPRPPGSRPAGAAPAPLPTPEEQRRRHDAHRPAPRRDDSRDRDAKRPGVKTATAVPEVGRWRDMKNVRPEAFEGGDEWMRGRRRKSGDKRFKNKNQDEGITAQRKKKIKVGQTVTVSELAGATGIKGGEILKKLFDLGIMATINQVIDGPTAQLIAAEFNIEIEADTRNLEDLVREEDAAPEALEARPPIVTVMGHVDHGKTSLLDRIRESDKARHEAGGITQHIGAHYVKSQSGDIVFLDTPGHEAFTSLRARGADITDLVILVVAADDGVMPQTVEAIEHAKAAEVPIMVAINKIDKPGADVNRIKTQLMEYNLLAEELGGDTVYVPVSAKTGAGIDQLLEMVHIQAEMLDLKATSTGMARGYVIESQMDRRRGPVATVIVQRGTLKVGDHFVAGTTFGRVRALMNDKGKAVDSATPSIPVEVLGCDEPPQAGDVFVVMEDEKVARQIASLRAKKQKEADTAAKRRVHLEDFFQTMGDEEVKILNLVVKTDAQGSLEAIRSSLAKLGNETVKVNIIRAGVGGITETDVSLATTSNAIVVGFSVRPEAKALALSQSEGLDIKLYTVIYDLINDVHNALEGMLKPLVREKIIGHAEVRKVFATSKGGIAGAYVTDGQLTRHAQVRLFRENVLVFTGPLLSLRRFNDDVSEVEKGYECGLRMTNFDALKEGDLLEAFVKVEEAQVLERAEPSRKR